MGKFSVQHLHNTSSSSEHIDSLEVPSSQLESEVALFDFASAPASNSSSMLPSPMSDACMHAGMPFGVDLLQRFGGTLSSALLQLLCPGLPQPLAIPSPLAEA